ncbi:hypothetical protein FBU30_001202 [Linnemannia zychae]|nr:hypothetical protein FBU30_001202 [Linnemannia zychae]
MSYQTHGSEDDESFLSNGGSHYSSSTSKSTKKLSKKERQLQKQLQKQEQQRQQQQQQRLRCLCYLDTSLDNQLQLEEQQQLQQQQEQQQKSSKSKSKKKNRKDKEGAGRLRRIWNESVIFQWTKPTGSTSSSSQALASPSPSPSPSCSSGYHHHTVAGGESSMMNNNGSQFDIHGTPARHSLSGTDISDEGNHTLSDIEDDLESEQFRHLRLGSSTHSNSLHNNFNPNRVSFQGPYGESINKSSSATTTSRPKDDLKAIARHQAELSLQQESTEKDDDFQYVMEDDSCAQASRPPVPPHFNSHTPTNDSIDDDNDDDDDEDWDIHSDSGAPPSTPMYSANVREPTCRSTLALPLSTPAHNRAYLKKPSNANLNGGNRQRCLSLPADTLPPKGGFLKKLSSPPSENWDADFDISADIRVPSKVVENQMSLQMDLHNIMDFASQIEDLKSLTASLRVASSSLKATNPKKHQDLSMLFQRDLEQAEVIIDLGEIAQTSGPTHSSSSSSSTSTGLLSLQHSSKKSSEPSLAALSVAESGSSSPKAVGISKLRRPALSTSAPAHHPLDALSSVMQGRSDSQSSRLTGVTLVGSSLGDTESDGTVASSRTSSRASSSASAKLKIDTDVAIEGLAISHGTSASPPISGEMGRNFGRNKMRQPSMACMKESCSSPAGLGICHSPMTPLRNASFHYDEDDDNEDDEYDDTDLEIKYDGPMRFPEGEQPFRRGFHGKEDSSATVKPLSPRSPRDSSGFQMDMEASFRRYQKYSHYSKRRTTGGIPNASRCSPIEADYRYEYDEDDEDGDDEEDDDGYESYDQYGEGSSIGVFTPIPSNRHMQVLKDILTEGLGIEVARQYMFKQGEQDHVRFSVEVIPGLLGHLRGLQQRLGNQLTEMQQLTVIV